MDFFWVCGLTFRSCEVPNELRRVCETVTDGVDSFRSYLQILYDCTHTCIHFISETCKVIRLNFCFSLLTSLEFAIAPSSAAFPLMTVACQELRSSENDDGSSVFSSHTL